MSASNTPLSVVLRFRLDGDRLRMVSDRRRYSRFGGRALTAKLSVIRPGETGLELEPCTLFNVSYGGMCFLTQSELQKGEEQRFLLDMAAPLDGLVVVRARICWVRQVTRRDRIAGAVFVESSKGWLGPETVSEE